MPTMIPMFQPRGETIAELLMRQGDISGRAALMRGEAIARGIQGVGEAVAQGVTAYGQQKDQKKREAMLDQAFTSFDPAKPMETYRQLALVGGSKFALDTLNGFIAMRKLDQTGPDPEAGKLWLKGVAAQERLNPGYIGSRWQTVGPMIQKYGSLFGMEVPAEPGEDIGKRIIAIDDSVNGKGQDGPVVVGKALVSREGKELYRADETPGNPEPVVINGKPTMASPAEIAQAKAAGKSVTPYQAPRQTDPVAAELASLRLEEARGKADAAKAGKTALEQMGSEWGGVIGRATSSMPAARQGAWRETFARAAQSGDKDELAASIRQAAIEGENVDVKNQVVGRMATVASLEDARSILNEMKTAGVPMNWFAGNMEDLARKLGTSTNPQYVALGNRLAGTLINYRRAATGVQFGDREQAQYEKMFPNYRQTMPVNLALIDGLMREMKTYDRVYWENKLGKKGARLVGALPDEAAGAGSGARPTAVNPKTGERVEWDGKAWVPIK